MLLNYDKFVEGITEIGLVEDDLQVVNYACYSLHDVLVVSPVSSRMLQQACVFICVGCLCWYQSSSRAVSFGQDRCSDQHQGRKADQAQACIRALVGGAAEAAADL